MAGNGAQIIGKVNPDLSVKVYNALDLGDDVGTLLTAYLPVSSGIHSPLPFGILS